MAGPAIGHGSKFEIESVTPLTFTEVVGSTEIQFGSNKVDTHDTTELGSAGNTRKFIGGLENSGDVTVKFNVHPGDTTQAYLRAAKDGTVKNFKAIYPGAIRTRSFPGIITSIDESIPDDKFPTFSVKIQVNGDIVDS